MCLYSNTISYRIASSDANSTKFSIRFVIIVCIMIVLQNPRLGQGTTILGMVEMCSKGPSLLSESLYLQ